MQLNGWGLTENKILHFLCRKRREKKRKIKPYLQQKHLWSTASRALCCLEDAVAEGNRSEVINLGNG